VSEAPIETGVVSLFKQSGANRRMDRHRSLNYTMSDLIDCHDKKNLGVLSGNKHPKQPGRHASTSVSSVVNRFIQPNGGPQ